MSTQHNVAVLMATYNGMAWIDQQIESVLNQVNVNVHIFVSDDLSVDSTVALINYKATQDNRISLLPVREKFGSAGKNFFRLIIDIDLSAYDYVGFCDQDDIWELDKLARHINLAKLQQADGVSSNVLAFWPSHKKKLIMKSQEQKKWDFLFESAGPGCTFLMTPWLVNKVREQLADVNSPARSVALHDWLSYAVCRAHGRKWLIDSVPSLLYRQHERNVLGANVGFKAKLARLAKLSQGWYRDEVIKIVKVCNSIQPNSDTLKISTLLQSDRFCNRIRLLAFVPEARRSLFARFTLAFCILIGLF